MKLNLNFYKNKEESLRPEEQKWIEYILKEKEGKDEERVKEMVALSKIKENILSWYPFKENSNILEIGANLGEITGTLCQNANRVVSIESSLQKAKTIEAKYREYENLEVIAGDINDITLEEKFAYVIIMGIEEREYDIETLLIYAKKHMQLDGTIFISLNNILGLNQLNGLEDVDYTPNKENKFMTKKEIENILNNMELNTYKFYYPLPNYKIPNIIFTDKHLPSHESILRDLTLYTKNKLLSFEEREIYRKILYEDRNMFPEFANSFLIEISNNIENKIEYVSFGNSRKQEYRLETVLLEGIAYKKPVNEKAKEHLEKMKKNIEILKNSNIYMLDSYENDKIISKLVKNEKSLDKSLVTIFHEKGQEEFLKEILKFKNELENKLEKSEEDNMNIFQKYHIKIQKELQKKLHFVKYGIFDLIFQNCFSIDNKYYFYDQEWMEENMPLEFIIYRAVTYLCNSEKDIDANKILEGLGLKNYINIFDELEDILQKQIKDDMIWSIHAENNRTIKNMYDTLVHERNLEAIKAQEKYNEILQIIDEKNKSEREYINEIQEKKLEIEKLQAELNYIKNSRSWKLTKPLRSLREKMK